MGATFPDFRRARPIDIDTNRFVYNRTATVVRWDRFAQPPANVCELYGFNSKHFESQIQKRCVGDKPGSVAGNLSTTGSRSFIWDGHC